jgi:hypothetical protein
MDFIKKEKSFAENVVYNYLNGYDNGEDLIQEGYKLALENYEFKMFKKIYSLSKLEPDDEIKNLIEKIFSESENKKFLELLVSFK